jgi:hypothetical protein
MYLGLFEIDTTLSAPVLLEVASVPANPASNPAYRIYDGGNLIQNGTGFLTPADAGDVEGANTSSPITITSVAHGLVTGNIVTVKNVGGQTGANGTFAVTRLTDDTFQLIGSTTVSAYTSGGTWQVAGVYLLEVDLQPGSGFDVGGTYQVLVNWTEGSDELAAMFYFAVT